MLPCFPRNRPSKRAKKSVFLTTAHLQPATSPVLSAFVHISSFRPRRCFPTHRSLDVLMQLDIKSAEARVKERQVISKDVLTLPF